MNLVNPNFNGGENARKLIKFWFCLPVYSHCFPELLASFYFKRLLFYVISANQWLCTKNEAAIVPGSQSGWVMWWCHWGHSKSLLWLPSGGGGGWELSQPAGLILKSCCDGCFLACQNWTAGHLPWSSCSSAQLHIIMYGKMGIAIHIWMYIVSEIMQCRRNTVQMPSICPAFLSMGYVFEWSYCIHILSQLIN